jgi:DNA-binding NarL/FixJ family response regulator
VPSRALGARKGSTAALTAVELLVLQLLALGYVPAQVASLLEMQEREVVDAAVSVARRVGTADWRRAAAAAARRGLINAS